MASSILILGAGELGLCIINSLTSHPLYPTVSPQLSVLLRSATLDPAAPPHKQSLIQHLRSLGVQFETADVTVSDAASLASIFGKYETIISCNGMGLPSGTQNKLSEAVLLASKQGGKTKRYFPWQFGMDYDIIGEGSSQGLFDEQLQVRKKLRAQTEVEWTIVSTGLFMSFLFEPAFGVVDLPEKKIRALGSWQTEITVTTPEDIGKVTAEIVLHPKDEVANRVVYTAGDTLSYGSIADEVEKSIGGQWERECWDLAELKRQMETDGGTMVKYRDTFAQGKGVAWSKAITMNEKRGIEMTDLRKYLGSMTQKA